MRALAVLLGLVAACEGRSQRTHPHASLAGTRPAEPSARAAALALDAGQVAERVGPSCRERLRSLGEVETSPLPELSHGATRARLLAEVKATPVAFVVEPTFTGHDPIVRGLRRQLETSAQPGRPLARLLARFGKTPGFVRAVVLTDGYVYARTPELGFALVEALKLADLFDEPALVIERGAERLLVQRNEAGVYQHVDGPEQGRRAQLLLFDRLWAEGEEPGPPLHVDGRAVLAELGAEELTLERVGGFSLGARARYGELSLPVLLERRGANLALGCVDEGEHAPLLSSARERAAKAGPVLERLRQVIREQVDEDLPFDEPKTEFGQEDGKLRQEWRHAYADGRLRYEYNGDRYAVFDRLGRPRVPQVCIDFVFDTFERLGGTWYRPAGEPRGRQAGRFDADQLGMQNRRNVEEFMALAERRPDLFELYVVPPDERVPLRRRALFMQTLYERRAQYRPGDVVVILGLRDDDQYHYHSFFVFDDDPFSGMPTLVAANAGRPRIRVWATEMAPAPKRSVWARVRPRLEWLESIAHP